MGRKIDTTHFDELIINYICQEIVKKRGVAVTTFTSIAEGIGYKWKFEEIRERIVTLSLFKINHAGVMRYRYNSLEFRVNTKSNRKLYKIVDECCINETEWKDITIDEISIKPRTYEEVISLTRTLSIKHQALLEKLEKAEYQTKKVKEVS